MTEKKELLNYVNGGSCRPSPHVPVAFAERQREVFPEARIVIMEGSGHWPFADDPDGVARVVIPFLRQVLGHEAAGEP
jgi:pimeloyl-ACP methyl ester carboxylesterase